MRLKMEIQLRGMDNVGVNHRACPAVSAAIRIILCLGEEADVMAFPYDDDCDGWFDLLHFTSLCN